MNLIVTKQIVLFMILLNVSLCLFQKPLLKKINSNNEIRFLQDSVGFTDTTEPSTEEPTEASSGNQTLDTTEPSTEEPTEASSGNQTLDTTEPSTEEPTEASSGNQTLPETPIHKSSSGLSTGGILAIAIPAGVALLGVAAAAALCKGGVPPQPTFTPPSLPPPTFVDTTINKLNVVPELPPQQPIIQPQPIVNPPPQIQPPPQPQPIPKPIRPNYPINKIEPPAINRAFQPLYTVQQPIQQPMQMVPVQQVQMVPVQQVEMVPVQEIVPVQQMVPMQQVVGNAGQVIQGAQIPVNDSNLGFSVSNLI